MVTAIRVRGWRTYDARERWVMNDDFVKWFEAQHGPRPGWDRLSDEDLANRVIAGEIAKEIILRRDEWDARRESALYAWQAREQAKGG